MFRFGFVLLSSLVLSAPVARASESSQAEWAMTELFDNMTPDQIGEIMGFPESLSLFQPMNESAPLVRITVSIARQSLWLETFNPVSGKYDVVMSGVPVSTGKTEDGYHTKKGCHTVKWTAKMHYSRKYDLSPMPFSVFYYGGFAIHGTNAIRNLGSEASHGCVRTHPNDAKEIYGYVKLAGEKNSQVCVLNETWQKPKSRRRSR